MISVCCVAMSRLIKDYYCMTSGCLYFFSCIFFLNFPHTIGNLQILPTASNTIVNADINTLPNIPSGQLQALHTLYDTLDGPHWNWQDIGNSIPWDFSTPNPNPCLDRWQGIDCSLVQQQSAVKTISSHYILSELDLSHLNLTGRLPQDPVLWQNLSSLTSLSLAWNSDLASYIPDGLGQLTNLTSLYLHNIGNSSAKRSPIPDIFYGMSHLYLLDFSVSHRNGTIPPSIYALSNLTYLDLGENKLSGTLSDSLCVMESLQYLFLSINKLTGSIPNCSNNVSRLNTLILSGNVFTSTIPSTLYTINTLESLYLDNNFLHGNISESIIDSNLMIIEMTENLLTGSIYHIVYMKQLEIVGAAMNTLEGPVPCTSERSMTVLSSYTNLLTGSLSQCNFSQMIVFDVYDNLLSGILPEDINSTRNVFNAQVIERIEETAPISSAIELLSKIPWDILTSNISGSRLYYFHVGTNYFTGSLPNWLFTLPFLVYAIFENNMLTGQIPAIHINSSILGFLYIEDNFLTGTIPSSIIDHKHFISLQFSNNTLSGSIPSEIFANNPNILTFSLQNNMFSGSLPNPGNHLSLQDLILSSNQFTGTIPWEYFSIPKLELFAISDNCLSGSLSEEICNAHQLQSLILDGLSSAPVCQDRIFPPSMPAFDSFRLKKKITGSIPSCIFGMPHMRNIYLSGNGISGSIPYDVNVSSSMEQLYLSYNMLTGKIPAAIQSHPWVTLDMSYNKLKGNIKYSSDSRQSTNNKTNPSLYLDVNRLSGNIPSSLKHLQSISILSGNLLYCNLNRHELPLHDPKVASYNCGSENIQLISIIVGALVFLVTVIILSCCYYIHDFMDQWVKPFWRNVKLWYYASQSQSSISVSQTFRIMNYIVRIGSLIASVLVILLMPVYDVINMFYSMYENKYEWAFSAIYMTGLTPGIVLMIVFTGTILAMHYYFEFQYFRDKTSTHLSDSLTVNIVESDGLIYSAIAGMTNVICIVLVNVGFVLIVVYVDNRGVIIFAQMLLALIKILWNDVLMWRLLQYCKAITHNRANEVTAADVSLMVSCLLFNNIVAPCFSTMVISPSCFYNAFIAAPSITVDYHYCAGQVRFAQKGSICAWDGKNEVSFSPPFIYGYNCASLLLLNYGPVFVYMAIVTGAFTPIGKLSTKMWYDWILTRKDRIAALLLTRVDPFIRLSFKPYQAHPPTYTLDRRKIFADQDLSRVSHLFYRDRYVVRVIGLFTIMISFGVMYPPLAVAMALAIASVTLFEVIVIGKVLHDTKLLGYTWYSEKLEMDVQGMSQALNAAVLPITFTASLLFGFLVFDTIGDERGFHQALSAGLVMLLVPVMLWMCFRAFRYVQQTKVLEIKDKEVQMSQITENPINTLRSKNDSGEMLKLSN